MDPCPCGAPSGPASPGARTREDRATTPCGTVRSALARLPPRCGGPQRPLGQLAGLTSFPEAPWPVHHQEQSVTGNLESALAPSVPPPFPRGVPSLRPPQSPVPCVSGLSRSPSGRASLPPGLHVWVQPEPWQMLVSQRDPLACRMSGGRGRGRRRWSSLQLPARLPLLSSGPETKARSSEKSRQMSLVGLWVGGLWAGFRVSGSSPGTLGPGGSLRAGLRLCPQMPWPEVCGQARERPAPVPPTPPGPSS